MPSFLPLWEESLSSLRAGGHSAITQTHRCSGECRISSERWTLETWRSSHPVGIHTGSWPHWELTVQADHAHLYKETSCWWQRCAQRILGLGSQDPVNFGRKLLLKPHLTGLPGYIFRRKTDASPVNSKSIFFPVSWLESHYWVPNTWDSVFYRRSFCSCITSILYPTPFYKKVSLSYWDWPLTHCSPGGS